MTIQSIPGRIAAALALVSFAGAVGATGIAGHGTWQTTLLPRDINGDGVIDAYYDTTLKITWLANWNVNGGMTWNDAMAWAAGLNVYGLVGWRLPVMSDTGTIGCNYSYSGTDCGYNVDTSTSEIAHMWYVTLGGKPLYDTAGNNTGYYTGPPTANDANFVGMQYGYYWIGTSYKGLPPGRAWSFSTNVGQQGTYALDGANGGLFAVAVHDGDVQAIPEPATYGLLLAGIMVISASMRRSGRVRSGTRETCGWDQI